MSIAIAIIPAQAGTQSFLERAAQRHFICWGWTPAYAGVTKS